MEFSFKALRASPFDFKNPILSQRISIILIPNCNIFCQLFLLIRSRDTNFKKVVLCND